MKFNNFLTKNPYLILFVSALMVVFSVTYFTLAQGTVTTIGEYIEIKEPTQANHAATKNYVDASIPPGSLDYSLSYIVTDSGQEWNVYRDFSISCAAGEVLLNVTMTPPNNQTSYIRAGNAIPIRTKTAMTVRMTGYGSARTVFLLSGLCVPYSS